MLLLQARPVLLRNRQQQQQHPDLSALTTLPRATTAGDPAKAPLDPSAVQTVPAAAPVVIVPAPAQELSGGRRPLAPTTILHVAVPASIAATAAAAPQQSQTPATRFLAEDVSEEVLLAAFEAAKSAGTWRTYGGRKPITQACSFAIFRFAATGMLEAVATAAQMSTLKAVWLTEYPEMDAVTAGRQISRAICGSARLNKKVKTSKNSTSSVNSQHATRKRQAHGKRRASKTEAVSDGSEDDGSSGADE